MRKHIVVFMFVIGAVFAGTPLFAAEKVQGGFSALGLH